MPWRPNKEGQMVEGGQKQAAQCCRQKGRGEGGPYDQERDLYPSSLSLSFHGDDSLWSDFFPFAYSWRAGPSTKHSVLTSHLILIVLLCHFTAIKTHPPSTHKTTNVNLKKKKRRYYHRFSLSIAEGTKCSQEHDQPGVQAWVFPEVLSIALPMEFQNEKVKRETTLSVSFPLPSEGVR